MTYLAIALLVLAVWFASALITLFIAADDGLVECKDVAAATVLGPVSFAVMLWTAAESELDRLWRRVTRFVTSTVDAVRAWFA